MWWICRYSSLHDGRNIILGVAALGLVASAACSLWPGTSDVDEWPRQEAGTGETGVAYVDNETCADCHRAEYDAWSGSHHDLAMQEATEETVLGDFNDATFTHFGVTSRFFENGRVRLDHRAAV